MNTTIMGFVRSFAVSMDELLAALETLVLFIGIFMLPAWTAMARSTIPQRKTGIMWTTLCALAVLDGLRRNAAGIIEILCLGLSLYIYAYFRNLWDKRSARRFRAKYMDQANINTEATNNIMPTQANTSSPELKPHLRPLTPEERQACHLEAARHLQAMYPQGLPTQDASTEEDTPPIQPQPSSSPPVLIAPLSPANASAPATPSSQTSGTQSRKHSRLQRQSLRPPNQ